jgi:hypothetical protein
VKTISDSGRQGKQTADHPAGDAMPDNMVANAKTSSGEVSAAPSAVAGHRQDELASAAAKELGDEWEVDCKTAAASVGTPILALLCLVQAAIWWKLIPDKKTADAHPRWDMLNICVLAFWTLGPPIWFWTDWYRFPTKLIGSRKWESMIHGHEVSRNIWLALVVVLAALLRTSWSFP